MCLDLVYSLRVSPTASTPSPSCHFEVPSFFAILAATSQGLSAWGLGLWAQAESAPKAGKMPVRPGGEQRLL